MAQILEMQCAKCKISEHCPKNGSSPLVAKGRPELCHIIGGYGRKPVQDNILSEESKQLAAKQGNCLSIAEIPIYDDHTGKIYRETVKIFHSPILHPREKTNLQMDRIYPKNHR